MVGGGPSKVPNMAKSDASKSPDDLFNPQNDPFCRLRWHFRQRRSTRMRPTGQPIKAQIGVGIYKAWEGTWFFSSQKTGDYLGIPTHSDGFKPHFPFKYTHFSPIIRHAQMGLSNKNGGWPIKYHKMAIENCDVHENWDQWSSWAA